MSSKFFSTRDGVRLHYLEEGEGDTLVFFSGWSQTAALWREQFSEFSRDFHCLALDWRGHGESEKPASGYRISRLAMDAHEWLESLGVERATFIAHSMACRVTSYYWELFGDDRLSRIVWIDQAPRAMRNPAWTDEEQQNFGGRLTYDQLEADLNEMAEPNGEAFSADYLSRLFSPDYPRDRFDWVLQENLKFPRHYAAFLLRETLLGDVRDILPRITAPTLVVGGEASLTGIQSQRWVASQIPRGRLATIPANQGGSHFCFLENPPLFNEFMRSFLTEDPLC